MIRMQTDLKTSQMRTCICEWNLIYIHVHFFFYRWAIERLAEQKYRETHNKDPRCIFIKHWNSKGTSFPEMEECQLKHMYLHVYMCYNSTCTLIIQMYAQLKEYTCLYCHIYILLKKTGLQFLIRWRKWKISLLVWTNMHIKKNGMCWYYKTIIF